MKSPEDKILSFDQAAALRVQLHAAGKRLVVTNGCFDLVHRGHLSYLYAARQEGDALLVALNGDASIRELKGPHRPILSEDDRAYLLGSLSYVDAVVIFPQRKPLALFRAVPPDIYVKGGDYNVDTIDQEERVWLEKCGCQFRFLSHVPGASTTDMVARIQAGLSS